MKKVLYSTSIFLLLYVISCIYNGKTVSDVMMLKGFNEKSVLFAQVSIGDKFKKINQHLPSLFEPMKSANLVDSISSSPSLHIHMQTGSSLPSQVIRIHISESGEGSIEYKDNKIAYFQSTGLYETALESFNKSNINLKGD